MMRRRTLLRAIATLPPLIAAARAGAASSARAQGASPRLAITRERDLSVRGLAGGEQLVMRASSGVLLRYPTWSPDGTQIAFVQESFGDGPPRADDGHDLYVVDAGGGE